MFVSNKKRESLTSCLNLIEYSNTGDPWMVLFKMLIKNIK